MKSYDHCTFEHERAAFGRLAQKMPHLEGLELYPSVYIPDQSRNVYHECDLLVISESFAAVVELKHWHGDIEIGDNVWWRGGRPVRDPHEVNLPKAKVFKGILERELPAARIPFVQSIVVLTEDSATVVGAHRAHDVIRELDRKEGRVGDHLTFNGIDELAQYLKVRCERDQAAGRAQLRPQEFRKLRGALDQRFEAGLQREDYADQVSGFHIRQELENTPRFVSYLAEPNPARGDTLYRLRVFGPASDDEAERARQYRSLDALERLPFHPNIRRAHSHANERRLVVEVCQWSDVQTLDELLQSGTSLSHSFSARIVRDVARALAHVHTSAAGLIHRNVTPRSVVIGRDDHIELIDFDLAYDPGACYTVMADEFSALERRYFAPEAIVGSPDYASDVYSLGQLLSDVLAAAPAEQGEDPALRALVTVMTSNAPNERPSAQEVADELSAYLGETPPAAAPVKSERPKEPEVGDSYDTWKLVAELGRGATSRVFRGESLGDSATLKIFQTEVPRDRCLAERDFLRAARSPFIVGFRGFTQWAGAYWCIIQDHVKGKSLRTLIQSGARPSAPLFEQVAKQMLDALEALHSPPEALDENARAVPVIHNDVTPGNIIVDDERGVAKLIDFGLASPAGLTVIGGTPGYVATDLVTKDGYLATPAGDVYALAVSLVEWATGLRPEAGAGVPPLFADTLEPAVAESLAEVFRQALDPSARFESAQGLRQALIAALESPAAAEPEAHATPEIAPVAPSVEHVEAESVTSSGSSVAAFVDYLNTIHNVSADNRHALAEAQATSAYFSHLHVPLPLTDSIAEVLAEPEGAVVMLTGHAGDGKSTVAVEMLKRALGLASDEPLPRPPAEEEPVEFAGRPLSVVKDMSELPASVRVAKLRGAMEGAGSALIVSNTGPLLSTFSQYFEERVHARDEIEQEVLRRLDEPLNGGRLAERNCFALADRKKVYIANLTMLDNVDTAVDFLDRLVTHPAWDECGNCSAASGCSVKRNVELLRARREVTRKRVHYVYERLTAYGRRMTMRQLAAHLSFSVTGGLSCHELRERTAAGQTTPLFSETFFGHVGALSARATDALFCLRQMADLHFGASSTPDFDQLLYEAKLDEVLELPASLDPELQRWQAEARASAGGGARRRLRRLAYMFGEPRTAWKGFEPVLIDDFLHSPMLRTLDAWVREGSVGVGLQKQRFIKKTIGVLMEEFTGCTVPEQVRDRLFITLRRPDERVLQSVQIVLRTVPVDEFDIVLETERRMPVLMHGSTGARLPLTLPLLDYIASRSRGELTDELDAIHRASLEQFRGELLGAQQLDQDVITVLEIDAEGAMKTHKFSADDGGQRLVYQ